MLTKVTVYSQWANIDPLVLNIINRPDTDLFEVRNIDGLGEVKADVNTAPLGSVDGESFIGAGVGKRNIIFTIGLTPDWNEWTVSRLRRLLAKYFASKLKVRLVFESMEFAPVEISGYVESNEPNMFSKDPEQQISIICPDLYFKSVDPVVINGNSDMAPIDIDYEGNVETGINVSVRKYNNGDPDATFAKIRVDDPLENSIQVAQPAGFRETFIMNSIAGDKYLRRINFEGHKSNLLNSAIIIDNNSRKRRWPMVGPGTDKFRVEADVIQRWTLTYYPLYGSL